MAPAPADAAFTIIERNGVTFTTMMLPSSLGYMATSRGQPSWSPPGRGAKFAAEVEDGTAPSSRSPTHGRMAEGLLNRLPGSTTGGRGRHTSVARWRPGADEIRVVDKTAATSARARSCELLTTRTLKTVALITGPPSQCAGPSRRTGLPDAATSCDWTRGQMIVEAGIKDVVKRGGEEGLRRGDRGPLSPLNVDVRPAAPCRSSTGFHDVESPVSTGGSVQRYRSSSKRAEAAPVRTCGRCRGEIVAAVRQSGSC